MRYKLSGIFCRNVKFKHLIFQDAFLENLDSIIMRYVYTIFLWVPLSIEIQDMWRFGIHLTFSLIGGDTLVNIKSTKQAAFFLAPRVVWWSLCVMEIYSYGVAAAACWTVMFNHQSPFNAFFQCNNSHAPKAASLLNAAPMLPFKNCQK